MKFLNIFNKQKKQEETVEDTVGIMSVIIFSVDEYGEVYVDINLKESTDDSVKSLSTLLATVASPTMPVTVLDMIKKSLIQEGRTEEYIAFIADYMSKTDAILEDYGQSVKEEPFIKPSDMI